MIFKSVIDEYLPRKQKRVKREVQPKWFTSDISREIKERDKLLNKARKSKLESDWGVFKQTKNKVTNLIRNTKQAYFMDKFSEHENNTKKLWNLIKYLSKDDEEKQIGIKNLTDNDENISDKTAIAEIINNFFIDQPRKLITALNKESLSDSFSTITGTGQHL